MKIFAVSGLCIFGLMVACRPSKKVVYSAEIIGPEDPAKSIVKYILSLKN